MRLAIEEDVATRSAEPGARRLGIDLRGRIILVLLVVGALSALATSWLGFQSGRENLTERIFAQLEGRRDVAARQVERQFALVRGHVRALVRDETVRTSLRQFGFAFPQVEPDETLRADTVDLRTWYERRFLPRLPVDEGVSLVADAFLPERREAILLQERYVAAERERRESTLAEVPDTRVDAYERVHRRLDPSMTAVSAAIGYTDIFLIAPDGTILYTVAKEPDFATNLIDGPYALTGLARAFLAARGERGEGFVHVEDFDFYRPSLDAPAAFVAAPVYDGVEFRGVVAVQVSAEFVTAQLGGDVGLGELGETFIVGVDGRIRSDMRLFREDRAAFLAQMREARGDTEAIEAMDRTNTTILNLDVVSPVIAEAARGRSGVMQLASNYAGVPALAAYAPLDLPGLDWIMKVEQPLSEALEPIARFQRQVLIAAVGLAIAITLFSMWAAGWFTEPIRALIERAQAVRAGRLDTVMRLERGDEFGELSDAMQGMTDELRARRDTADAARIRTESLLARFLPAGIVRDVKDRDPETDEFNIAEEVESVSVVYAELTGYEGMMADTPPLEAIAALDRLVQLVDDAADRAGVEKLRTTGAAYLAVAGLSAPQLDHMQRAVAFARELHAIIARFRAESGLPIDVHSGVASGPAVAGVIGRRRLSFDMFGPAMGEAEALRDAAAPGEIRLGRMTVEVLGGVVETRPAPDGVGALLVDGSTLAETHDAAGPTAATAGPTAATAESVAMPRANAAE